MLRAVLFDLDGVLVSTDECHYQAWSRLCAEEGIPFSRGSNEQLRGVSRMESLEKILRSSGREYSFSEKEVLAARKNRYYAEMISSLSGKDLLPGAADAIRLLRERGIRIAVGSSSKNTPLILKQIGLEKAFDAVADGNAITRGKPDPEVFLLAARLVGVAPEHCLVVEDASAGVEAGKAGGMKVLAVGPAAGHPKADYSALDLAHAELEKIFD